MILTRRAETALKGVLVDECLLHRMQRLAASQAFDCRDLAAVGLGGEHHAGVHALTVEVNRASAALAAIASLSWCR